MRKQDEKREVEKVVTGRVRKEEVRMKSEKHENNEPKCVHMC